jgi:deoxyribose-phosphate aldolase
MAGKLIKIDNIKATEVASICDHTYLNRAEGYKGKVAGNESPIMKRESEFHRFLQSTSHHPLVPYAMCVRPEDVRYAKEFLGMNRMENVKVCSVVGFPDGQWYPTDLKVLEARYAIEAGADEIDMVINYTMLKRGNVQGVSDDIAAVLRTRQSDGASRTVVKVILETSELGPKQIAQACQICEKNYADFVKTSTGFSAYGARVEDVLVMRENFSRGIKISGGVNETNYKALLTAMSGRTDGMIELDPMKIRIGESSLMDKLL